MNELSVPEFERAAKLAKELRLLQPTADLALDVLSMDFDRYIYFDTFEAYSRLTNVPLEKLTMNGKLNDGYTVRLNGGINLILYYEKNKGTPRLNWTLAHEVGHIYLNHDKDGRNQEVGAHWFAAELLMPTLIFCQISRKITFTPERISRTFFVSEDAARNKIDTLRRSRLISSYLTKELSEKYKYSVDTVINFYYKKTDASFSEVRIIKNTNNFSVDRKIGTQSHDIL